MRKFVTLPGDNNAVDRHDMRAIVSGTHQRNAAPRNVRLDSRNASRYRDGGELRAGCVEHVQRESISCPPLHPQPVRVIPHQNRPPSADP